MTVSANLEHRSGLPWARQATFTGGALSSITLRVEPIGTRRLPNLNTLDPRVEKALRLGPGRAVLRGNVYNVLNASTVTNVTMVSGPTFNRPFGSLFDSGILLPRILEFSIGYTF